MTGALGRHILCDAYGCDSLVLNNIDEIRAILVDSALKAGAEIREVTLHKFTPQGVSGVVVISESHLSIHTWPELGLAALDVFTCGDNVDPWVACDLIVEALHASEVKSCEIKRVTDTDLIIDETNNR